VINAIAQLAGISASSISLEFETNSEGLVVSAILRVNDGNVNTAQAIANTINNGSAQSSANFVVKSMTNARIIGYIKSLILSNAPRHFISAIVYGCLMVLLYLL